MVLGKYSGKTFGGGNAISLLGGEKGGSDFGAKTQTEQCDRNARPTTWDFFITVLVGLQKKVGQRGLGTRETHVTDIVKTGKEKSVCGRAAMVPRVNGPRQGKVRIRGLAKGVSTFRSCEKNRKTRE